MVSGEDGPSQENHSKKHENSHELTRKGVHDLKLERNPESRSFLGVCNWHPLKVYFQ